MLACNDRSVRASHPTDCAPGFDQHVIVVVHCAVGLTQPMKLIGRHSQPIEKRTAIRVVVKDRLASLTATPHGIDGAYVFDSQTLSKTSFS